jgi:DNA (cytosine-5)-methyltransferase 1
MGYHRAGFTDIVGVDSRPQPRYPFAFVLGDALEYVQRHGGDFDVIHASPPCQGFSAMNRAVRAVHPDYIECLRAAFACWDRPHVIENVEGAPLKPPAYVLCGTMFGLAVRRHRVFEVRPFPFALVPPCQCKNGVVRGLLIGHRLAGKVAPGRTQPPHHTEADRLHALQVPWMSTKEARQAIPPAYTQFLGRELLRMIDPR